MRRASVAFAAAVDVDPILCLQCPITDFSPPSAGDEH
jgi:hypothetical protein